MKKLLLTICFAALLLTAHAQFGQLLGWQFANPAVASPALPTAAFYQALGMESSTLTRGSGYTPASLARAFSSTSASYTASNSPTVRAANEYYEFTVQAKPGSVISLSGIDAKLRRTGGGANTYRWAYSVNGGTFTDIGTADIPFSDTNTSGVQQPTIDLTSITDLQNLTSSTTITFRLYGWGFTSIGGTFAFAPNASSTDLSPALVVQGTVVGGERLLGWNFNIANAGAATTGLETSVTATAVNSNLSPSVLNKVGFGNSSLPRGISATGTIGTTKVDGEYYEFDVTPIVSGKFVSLTLLDARLRRTSGGATTYAWSYSVDNGPFVQLASSGTFVVADEGYIQPSIDLSGIAALKNLVNGTVVKFRLHGWGFTTTGGTFAIGRYPVDQVQNSLEVTGFVTDAPLPVSLSNFAAKANKQGTISLTWLTTAEQNNSHFEIKRSADGKVFSTIGQVTGANNSTTRKNYTYVDQKPMAGLNYYQLKQIDFDGNYSLSSIAWAKAGLNVGDLSVGVNAGKSAIKINFNANENGSATFSVYTISGAKLASTTQNVVAGSNQITLPVALTQSLHILKVAQNGLSSSVKF